MSNSAIYTFKGCNPIFVVAPHGFPTNDYNSDRVAKSMINHADAYGLINVGLDRKIVNCNDISECLKHNDGKEFIQHYFDIKEDIIERYGICYVFLIHGMNLRSDKTVDIVMGYGQDSTSSHSCELTYKNQIRNRLRNNFNVYEEKKNGKFSASNKNNLNQYWRQWKFDTRVQSIQLELSPRLRYVTANAVVAGKILAEAASKICV